MGVGYVEYKHKGRKGRSEWLAGAGERSRSSREK